MLRAHELIGRHVIAGAALIVSGGVLIGAFRFQHRRAPRPRCILRRRRGAGGPVAPPPPAHRRRRSSRARRRRHCELRGQTIRHPLGDELREALRPARKPCSSRPRHELYRRYSRAVWDAVRRWCPRRAHGHRRGVPRPGAAVAAIPQGSRGRRGRAGGGARRDGKPDSARSASHRARSSRRWRATGGNPAGSPSCRRAARPRFSRRSSAPPSRSRPAGRGAAARGGVETWAQLAALDGRLAAALLPGRSGVSSGIAHAGRPARPRDSRSSASP